MTETTRIRKTFAEIQHDALMEQVRERADERRRVAEIILGLGNHLGSQRLGEIIRIGDDYVAEVIKGDRITWTTMVRNKSTTQHHLSQEHAILHLIAQRYDPNANSNVHAAFYAGRVLGIPEGE